MAWKHRRHSPFRYIPPIPLPEPLKEKIKEIVHELKIAHLEKISEIAKDVEAFVEKKKSHIMIKAKEEKDAKTEAPVVAEPVVEETPTEQTAALNDRIVEVVEPLPEELPKEVAVETEEVANTVLPTVAVEDAVEDQPVSEEPVVTEEVQATSDEEQIEISANTESANT